jgi:hypothetical protein
MCGRFRTSSGPTGLYWGGGGDEKTQVIVAAQAHGTDSEQELLIPVVDAVQSHRHPETVLAADAGYHREANLPYLAEASIDAYISDNGYRSRDPRYAEQDRHRAKPDLLYDKRPPPETVHRFKPEDFDFER